MKTTANIEQVRSQVNAWKMQGKKVAFVPTMGNLHKGHISLIEQAKQHADHVVASIFVNPMQFGANEDLDSYPRTLADDQTALDAAGTDLLFTPTPELMYPKGLEQQTFVEVPLISNQLCGASRPGHFRGVATIVCKLFNIVQPDVAVFGRKDYQQLLVINTMVHDLSLPIEIIGVETAREGSGLALSSRNGYLTAKQKTIAPMLKQSLDQLALAIQQGDEIAHAIAVAEQSLTEVGFKPDYIEVRQAQTLAYANATDSQLVILAAAYLGTTRLIDNLVFHR
ncbi:pantoate--beta-alanine ligase [Shewanella marina]|uniref:pantoate--beta-alanine ligase n=1 Tax=Shewanella marina TaxID=487319 RepID=UPI000471EFCE|nr:pantoate--beta-alanine ligase [Shewanella marina]